MDILGTSNTSPRPPEGVDEDFVAVVCGDNSAKIAWVSTTRAYDVNCGNTPVNVADHDGTTIVVADR
jgi:hypothetical protein